MRAPLFLLPLGLIAYFLTRPRVMQTIVQTTNRVTTPLIDTIKPIIRNAESVVNDVVKGGQAAVTNTTSAVSSIVNNISERGLQFIRDHEALRTRAYQDEAGLWTIGYGHKIVPGDGFNPQSVITPEQAEALYLRDAQVYINAVRNAVRVPISQNQFDALVSLAFNIGASGLANSTLIRKLNASDFAGAVAEFGRWIYTGGHVSQGLVTRRAAEAAIFNGAHI